MPDIKKLREKVQTEKKSIFAEHRNGRDGMEIAKKITGLVDRTIKEILDHVWEGSVSDNAEQPCSIIAIGGYGREELSPCSDIDLLTLYPKEMHKSAENLVNILIPSLWDIGFEVAHSFWTTQETIQMAKTDMIVKTSIIYNRLIWGRNSIFVKFKKAQWDNTVKKDIVPFMQYLEEMRQTIKKSPLGIAQPNIKNDTGGLRAVQIAFWAAFARFGIIDPDSLKQRGILTEQDVHGLSRSLGRLLRIRNELHFRENKKNDALVHEVQEKVASALGYKGTQEKMVKNFMKDYYQCVSELKEISDGLFTSSKNYRKGILKTGEWFHMKKIRKGLAVLRNEIFPYSFPPALFQGSPELIIEIFKLCQDQGYKISQPLKKTMRNSLDSIPQNFFDSFQFQEFIVSILKKRNSTRILRMMHENGVLGRFLPEFNEITHMVHYDFYHAYTIDEHTFQAIAHLEDLEKKKEGTLSEIYKTIPETWIVKLALLLHDIAKPEAGESRPHAVLSAKVAENVCARLGLSEKEKETVSFLIWYHLLLNLAARRRDTHDSKTIHELAGVVKSRKKLEMLYLLTYADMKAVSSRVWSNWFAFLLEDLYQRTADFMNIDESDRPGDEERVEASKEKIMKYLPPAIPKEFALGFLENASTRYLLSVPVQSIIGHIFLGASRKKRKPAVEVIHNPSVDCTEISMISDSRLGNLNRVSGVLASRGLNILETRIFRQKDKTSIDIMRFNDRNGKPVTDPDQLGRIGKEILRVFESMKPPTKGKGEAHKHSRPIGSLAQPRVVIKNDVSQTSTVIEIEANDWVGLIQSITYAFFKLGLNIQLAKIDTEGNRAIDAFYVTDKQKKPIHNGAQLEVIKKTLLEVL